MATKTSSDKCTEKKSGSKNCVWKIFNGTCPVESGCEPIDNNCQKVIETISQNTNILKNNY
jgi:hypothetical protein